MTGITEMFAGRRWSAWRIVIWVGAMILISLPAIAMQFTAEVDWDAADFIVMGALIALACGAVELAARASSNGAYRMAAIIAVGIAYLTVWANLAVGMIGSEDNPYNLLFGGVLGLALAGGIVVRFRASGLAAVMLLAGLTQASVAAFGWPADQRGAVFSIGLALPWFLSAALFRQASSEATS